MMMRVKRAVKTITSSLNPFALRMSHSFGTHDFLVGVSVIELLQKQQQQQASLPWAANWSHLETQSSFVSVYESFVNNANERERESMKIKMIFLDSSSGATGQPTPFLLPLSLLEEGESVSFIIS